MVGSSARGGRYRESRRGWVATTAEQRRRAPIRATTGFGNRRTSTPRVRAPFSPRASRRSSLVYPGLHCILRGRYLSGDFLCNFIEYISLARAAATLVSSPPVVLSSLSCIHLRIIPRFFPSADATLDRFLLLSFMHTFHLSAFIYRPGDNRNIFSLLPLSLPPSPTPFSTPSIFLSHLRELDQSRASTRSDFRHEQRSSVLRKYIATKRLFEYRAAVCFHGQPRATTSGGFSPLSFAIDKYKKRRPTA